MAGSNQCGGAVGFYPDPAFRFDEHPQPSVCLTKIAIFDTITTIIKSVADLRCSSQTLIFSIPDPGSNNNKKKRGKIVVLPYLIGKYFTKLEIISFFNR
jgi:hypothetical protein